ncbi:MULTISPECIES: histidinol dehydrogenase [Salimicrobium]|uniref:Histidinol dehydrogenase n=3 Tax=Salimicrobium TaxID=351195 RepID=K2FQ56_9BACI|nr:MULTISPECIES: histidinol dehydrogenase [Salimicrobium]AKG03928.1 histidinol dehydrogenase [Salimicrobium jeotgali]EKE32961.1 bifunctional histidinal dehydrogenase/ histidinol dehydrogenase [Salimicrobium jeotgali]MBM7695043.1 histidinol dehydrogenase [Salimicrobium jeotgali]SDX98598.1 histidinol dehydrogenase [Salimicrobium album]SIS70884.1 histidinol dehydrogenase [Salimicrobium salexigens]
MRRLTREDIKKWKTSRQEDTSDIQGKVNDIVSGVRRRGDAAVKEYTEKFDGISLSDFRVTREEISDAYESLSGKYLDIIQEAAGNIRRFHEKQLPSSWFDTSQDGSMLGQKYTPIDKAGVYVPGGTAAYPSSVMMNIIPAQVAGVERIAMVTPPGTNGRVPIGVLATAQILGVTEIYKIGGAQAIAALAYGTETIPAVDKITGPGNMFVALAKKQVFGDVDIDMIAGPSEIAVLCDHTARAGEVAADLLSQAEHDERSSAVCITTSRQLADDLDREVKEQLKQLPRKNIAEASINFFGGTVVVDTMTEAVDTVNEFAPEHLEVMTENPYEQLGAIRHAGAIFLGPYSSEPVGDYFAGPNHVLPTSGTARFSSPLNVHDFMKKSSVISYSAAAWHRNVDKIASFARLEDLEGHARAVEKRKERFDD